MAGSTPHQGYSSPSEASEASEALWKARSRASQQNEFSEGLRCRTVDDTNYTLSLNVHDFLLANGRAHQQSTSKSDTNRYSWVIRVSIARNVLHCQTLGRSTFSNMGPLPVIEITSFSGSTGKRVEFQLLAIIA